MNKTVLLLLTLISLTQLSFGVKVYSPFYDPYKSNGNGSKMAIPKGHYRTGWKAGRYRAHWHDKYPPTYLRRVKSK